MIDKDLTGSCAGPELAGPETLSNQHCMAVRNQAWPIVVAAAAAIAAVSLPSPIGPRAQAALNSADGRIMPT